MLKGRGDINFRDVFSRRVFHYQVSEKSFEVIDIPPGYTHNIINTGDSEMVVLMWANEIFQPENPDTYYLNV